MKRTFLPLILIAVLVLIAVLTRMTPPREAERLTCDVCVYGGTSAGVIAAYAVAQQGKSVLLVEPTRRLGGLSSCGLGQTDIGNKQVVRGLALDFYRRVGQHYDMLESWIFEPSVAEAVFKDFINRGQVRVLYDHRLSGIQLAPDKSIASIDLEHSADGSKAESIEARMFIDCSYEGDLMARAGVSYTVGREDNSVYGETYNGYQVSYYHQFPDGIDPYVEPGNPESGLLWGISTASPRQSGTGDNMVQAYNYRICLTDAPENRLPIERPAHYDASRYELLLRVIQQTGDLDLNKYFIISKMPNHKTDMNNYGAFSTDMIGMNHDYPEASYERRAEILEEHKDYTLGLLWFLGNDERVPDSLRHQMLSWGLPKDEYTETGHWSPQMYVREARRMVGQYVATQADCENRTTIADGVGMAAYTMDSHNCQRIVVEKDGRRMVKNEGDVEIFGGQPYEISYGSITPKRGECPNLLVPVCLSASHIAFGSIRMEPVFMLLAQSAARAAVLAIEGNCAVQDVDAAQIRRMYDEDPLLDGSTPDVVVDDPQIAQPAAGSVWERVNASGGYGRSFFIAKEGAQKAEPLAFPVKIQKAGRYKLYSYYIRRDDAPQVTPVTVRVGDSEYDFGLDASKIVVLGQTSGEWVELGEYDLNPDTPVSVTFSATPQGGRAVADAVLAVPQK